MPKEKVSKSGRKYLRKEVSHQLAISLGKLREQLGEMKFNSRLKKAAKVLTKGMDTFKKVEAQKEKSAIEVPSGALVVKPSSRVRKGSSDKYSASNCKKTNVATKSK
ncbi:MAG: hypothetical protein WC756_12950 [Taibaiella sp.]